MRIYTITVNDDSGAFDKRVNECLTKGWSLHGPPCISVTQELGNWDGKPYSRKKITYIQVLSTSN